MNKKIILSIAALLYTLVLLAQSPNTFNYQAILRNAEGVALTNESVNIGISILQSSGTGTLVFSESHDVVTNDLGLIQLEIGSELNGVGTLEAVDWSTGFYFIQISIDGTVMGTTQLLSVPYAMRAKLAENVQSFDYEALSNAPDFSNFDQDASDDFDGDYNNLSNLPYLFDGYYSSLIDAPATITPEQIAKIDFLTVTAPADLDQMKMDVETNNAKVSFPGFGTTAGTALAGDAILWDYQNGNMFHDGHVGVNMLANNNFYGSALKVNGGILHEGNPTTVYPGVLFYSNEGEGSFRYYNNLNEEKILGQDTVKFIASTWNIDTSVSTNNTMLINGSLGVGQDIVNGEVFGFNTLILKENNLRLLFDDVDTITSGFPYNDWKLEANASSNGGESYFAIVDETSGLYPVKVMAGAESNALYVASTGFVGIGKENPTSRLDVAGNIKANQFIGDGSGLTGITGATGGLDSEDNLLIAADNNSDNTGEIALQTKAETRMVITNDGFVGIGIASPTAELEVAGTGKFETFEAASINISNHLYQVQNNATDADITMDYSVLDQSIVVFQPATGNISISGLQDGVLGQKLTIINKGVVSMTFNHNGAGTQKFMLPGSVDLVVEQNKSASFIFDGTNWFCIAK